MIEQFGVLATPYHIKATSVKTSLGTSNIMFSKKNNPLVSNVIQIIIWFSQRAMKVAMLKKAALIPSVQTDVGLSVSYLYRNRGYGERGA